ncbi:hypothetical protein LPUS_07191 [Lasallia pustulata]|uniref:Tf2-1-like SH3-like domain-containing protein n=1 Tax=Lasallia pustulata TaxID=136370 RepID=A0A1W5D2K4_9LECA|nr:hypothetical protein LPUS_07191 [Lasallia pustulata]
MTIQEMEKALSEQTTDKTSEINISDLKDVFDPVKAKQLLLHQSYDHEIKIEGDQILAAKAKDITGTMENVLELMKKNAAKSQETMKRHADKHRKEITYEVGDQVFLSSKNITTDQPSKKIEDKMLGPFPIVKKVGTSYELELLQTMKVHNVFYSNLHRKNPGDPLPGQIQEPPGPIVIADGEEWDLADILNSHWHYGHLQYQCIVKDSHDRYLQKAGGKENLRALAQKKKKRRTR